MPSGPPGSARWSASRAATRRRLERRTRWSRTAGSGGSSRPRRSSRRRPSRCATRATRSSTPSQTGGGILSWLGIHDVDTLLWLTDEPVVEVSAMAASLGAPGLAVEDVISIALRFAGGAVGTVHLAYALPARGYRSRLALRGLDASLEFGLDEELVVVTAGGADGGVARGAHRVRRPGGPGLRRLGTCRGAGPHRRDPRRPRDGGRRRGHRPGARGHRCRLRVGADRLRACDSPRAPDR